MRTTYLRPMRLKQGATAALTSLALVGLAACSGNDTTEGSEGSSSDAAGSSPAGSRIAVSYEGGVTVLDGETLEVVEEADSEEFIRLNSAGDGRHVMVTVADGFQLLDTGAGTDEGSAELTDVLFEAEVAGHVVSHAGKTVLYADGTSDTTVMDTDAIASASEEAPATETIAGTEAHHGVSLVLEDGTFVTTVGNEDTRSGAVALRSTDGGEVVDENDQCPGIHGEGTAAGEAVVFGCEDGALMFDEGRFTKIDAPDQPYGRMGNAYVSESSPLVVGDYKTDPDAEGSLLDALTVIDTEAASLDVVDLPEGVEYTFQGVVRGPEDLAYLIGTDGAIHVLDPETRELTDSYPVMDSWKGPAEWQDAHPALEVDGDVGYVTDPAAQAVHSVDLTSGEVIETAELGVEPNEIAVAGG